MAQAPAQPQLYSTETGEAINASPDQYAQLVASGKAAFLKGASVPVMDAHGRPYNVSGEDFLGFVNQGGSYEPLESQAARAAKERYGNEPIRAHAEAAARGATLGLSDVGFRALGVPAEDLKGRKEANFTTPTEIGGAILPMLLTGGAGAAAEGAGGASALSKAARLAPSNLVSKAGTAVADATAEMLGSQGAKSLSGKIIQRALPSAAAGAVENAAFGAGNVISELALGDTDNVGEKAAAQIGGGFLLGGAMGAGLGLLFPHVPTSKLNETAPLASELDRAPQTVEHATDAAVNSSMMNDAEREAFNKGMSSRSKDAAAIEKAGEVFGVEVFPEQVTDSPLTKRLSGILDERVSPVAGARRQMKEQAISKVQSEVGSMMGEGLGLTEEATGKQMVKQVTEKFDALAEPHQRLYKILDENLPFVEASENAKRAIAANIKKLDGYNINGSLMQKSADYVLDNFPAMKTAKDIQNLAQSLMEKVNPAIPGERRVAQILKEKLDNLVENSTIRAGERLVAETGDKRLAAQVQEVLDAIPASKKAYASFREKLNAMAKELGRKKIGGLADFQEFIEGLKPYQVMDRMFDKRDSAFLKFMKAEFPEEANLLIQYQRTKMLDAAKKAESLAPLFKEVSKLSPEVRALMFSKEELQKLELAEKYLNNIKYGRNPKYGNPSGTAYTAHAASAFEIGSSALAGAGAGGAIAGPVGAVIGGLAGGAYKSATIQDYAIKKFIESGARGADGQMVGTLAKLESMAGKASKTIEGTAKTFLKNPAIPSAIGSKIPNADREEKKKKFKKTQDLLTKAAANPEALVDRAAESVSQLAEFAPKVASAISQKAVEGPMFLYSKMPKNPYEGQAFGLKKDWHPSDVEMAKFHRYVDAVEDPLETIKKLKEGKFTAEHAEALQAVYPTMYRELQAQVMEEIPKLKEELPYKKRVQLGILLNVPVDQTLRPEFITQMQMQHLQSTQAEANKQKAIRMKGADKLSFADNAKSGTERVLTRPEV